MTLFSGFGKVGVLSGATAASAGASGDPQWNNVSLLINADGGSIVNLSRYGEGNAVRYTVGTGGNPTASTTSPKFGSHSINLDGSSDHLTNAGGEMLDIQSGDWTMEYWMRFPSGASWSTSNQIYFGQGSNNQNYWHISNHWNTTSDIYMAVRVSGSSWATSVISSSGAVDQSDNDWHHYAFCNASNTLKIFKDGTEIGSGTFTGNANITNNFYIGAGYSTGGLATAQQNHYIDDFRLTKGVARYTSNFTVPTAHLITAPDPADYHWDDVVLLMDYDGNLTDTSPIGRTMTAVTGGATTGGSAAISTAQKKFGTHSLAIEGPDAGASATRVGGHLTTPHHANLLFGSGDFTIETFIRLNVQASGAVQDNGSVGGGYNMIATHIYFNGSTRLGWEWNINLSNTLSFRANIDGIGWGVVGDGSSALSADTWYHVAVCRDGTKIRQYIDGVLEHEATTSGSMTVPSPEQTLKIGRYELNTGSADIARHFDGYMDSFRITKAARYTTNFTIPTAQYPTGS